MSISVGKSVDQILGENCLKKRLSLMWMKSFYKKESAAFVISAVQYSFSATSMTNGDSTLSVYM